MILLRLLLIRQSLINKRLGGGSHRGRDAHDKEGL